MVTRQVEALQAVLPTRADLAFAVKANPNLSVLRHLAGAGLGADVASGGELRQALRAGFAADRIVFTGPGKRDEELRAAVEAGVRVVTVESVGELRRLARIAEGLGRTPADPPPRRRVRGREARARPARRRRRGGQVRDGRRGPAPRRRGGGRVRRGSSRWASTRSARRTCSTPGRWPRTSRRRSRRRRDLAAGAGFELRLVDAGGGLGIPYDLQDDPLDLRRLGARLQACADRLAANEGTRRTRLLLEPGRFLVGAAGRVRRPASSTASPWRGTTW